MTEVSSFTDEGSNGKCPLCHNTVRLPFTESLSEHPCSACGFLFWYVCVGSKAYVYNKDAMSADDWRELVSNVPKASDESLALVEKILCLESLESAYI